MSDAFAQVAEADLDAFLAETPLCWIVPRAAPETALLMPVVAQRDGDALTLLGHLPRSAPAARALAEDGNASFLFLGANAYVSPAQAGRDDWAPTWNFVSARLTGQVELDPHLTRPAVDAIVAAMEGPEGWRIDQLGTRADSLLQQVIGYRARIEEAAARFKLGQDESPQTRASIAHAFAGTPLGRWMDRAGAP